jgi:hypothetical protein
LIALQVARAAEHRHVPTLRERDLVQRIADACAGAIAPCLDGFVLERGFVSRCTTKPGMRATESLARHPAWATVDELYTADRNVLWNENLRARRLGIHGEELTLLARAPYPLPYEMIGGFVHLKHRGTRYQQTGVLYNPQEWARYTSSAAFARLRAFSVDVRSLPERGRLDLLLANSVGRALHHLDVWIPHAVDFLATFARTFRDVALPRLTLRGPYIGAVLGYERERVVLQLQGVMHLSEAIAFAAALETLITAETVLVVDDGSPAGETRHPELVALLEPRVGQIVLEPCPSLLP